MNDLLTIADEVLGDDGEPDFQPIDADDYAQPQARELAELARRIALPDIPGISYRCPPAAEDLA